MVDEGACRDLVDSLAEAFGSHVDGPGDSCRVRRSWFRSTSRRCRRCCRGRLSTASGYGRLTLARPAGGRSGLTAVLAAHDGDTVILLQPPTRRFRSCVPRARRRSRSIRRAAPRGWEGIAVAVEDGIRLHAGAVPTDGSVTGVRRGGPRLRRGNESVCRWSSLSDVVVTPACGLAGAPPHVALAIGTPRSTPACI